MTKEKLNFLLLQSLADCSDVIKMISAGAFLAGLIQPAAGSEPPKTAILWGIAFLAVACISQTIVRLGLRRGSFDDRL